MGNVAKQSKMDGSVIAVTGAFTHPWSVAMSTTSVPDHNKRGGPAPTDPDARFDAFVMPLPCEPGCWLWMGSTRSGGYGGFHVGGTTKVGAHRYAYERANGPIPHGLWVLHRCDTPTCVRPDHLFLGTAIDNYRDMVAKGRRGRPVWSRPRRTHCSLGHELTPDNVYLRQRNSRQCRICRRRLKKEFKRNKRIKRMSI